MTSAIRNHYIPQFYQRGFIADDSGLIWVYEKGRQPRQESVRQTGMELNLYAFVNQKKELDTQTVENELARLDSKWLYDRLRERMKSETETKTLFDKQKPELEEIREEYTRHPVSCFRVTHYVNRCSRKCCSLWIGHILGLRGTQNL